MLQIHIHREMAVYEPRREASGETDPASALNLVFQPPEQRESKCLLFKPPRVLWHPPRRWWLHHLKWLLWKFGGSKFIKHLARGRHFWAHIIFWSPSCCAIRIGLTAPMSYWELLENSSFPSSYTSTQSALNKCLLSCKCST